MSRQPGAFRTHKAGDARRWAGNQVSVSVTTNTTNSKVYEKIIMRVAAFNLAHGEDVPAKPPRRRPSGKPAREEVDCLVLEVTAGLKDHLVSACRGGEVWTKRIAGPLRNAFLRFSHDHCGGELSHLPVQKWRDLLDSVAPGSSVFLQGSPLATRWNPAARTFTVERSESHCLGPRVCTLESHLCSDPGCTMVCFCEALDRNGRCIACSIKDFVIGAAKTDKLAKALKKPRKTDIARPPESERDDLSQELTTIRQVLDLWVSI